MTRTDTTATIARRVVLGAVLAATVLASGCGRPAPEGGDAGSAAASPSPSGCGVPGYDPATDASPPAASPCPGGTPAGRGDDDTVVSGTPGSGDGRGKAQQVEPRPGMAGVVASGWDRAVPVRGGRVLRVFFWSGVEPCNVLDRVEVDYAENAVTVTLFQGHDPTQPDVACIEIAIRKVVEVDLTEPLDGRKVVDGAA
ncbi:MAG: hypothetical protein ABR575_06510 [Actinomycetota bacterium]